VNNTGGGISPLCDLSCMALDGASKARERVTSSVRGVLAMGSRCAGESCMWIGSQWSRPKLGAI
jgi:hypothetical protein